MNDEQMHAYLGHLQAGSLMISVPPDTVDAIVPNDPKDDPIVATAVAAKADVICTLDRHLHHEQVVSFCQRRKIEIVTDLELLRMLRPEPTTE
jgi:predicted nucleic acid-binding protein